MKPHLKPLVTLLAACPLHSYAADIPSLDEIVVTATKASLQPAGAFGLDAAELAPLRSSTSDSASLLRGIPGVSLYGAGGVSSLPAIHGLADDRVRVRLDGMDLMTACPNHMNAPLSYIDPSNVASAKVYAGITPVSVGGDSLGGTIQVDSAAPEFAAAGQGSLLKGRAGTFYRSNGDARGANIGMTLAGERLSMNFGGSIAQSGDYKAARDFKAATASLDGASVGSSAYKSENQQLGLALRHENHRLELNVGVQDIPYEGFPNQRMDMTRNDSTQVNLHYSGQYQWGSLDARTYGETTRHGMNFGDDKQFTYGNAPGMPMNTDGKTRGALAKADIALSARDILRVGSEFQYYRLNDWWPPSGTGGMSPNTFWNINNGERDRYAVFSEWEARWNPQWLSELGVRGETVRMETGVVNGYCNFNKCPTPISMMSSNYLADSTAFNSLDHQRDDHNLDFTALARYTPETTRTFELGYARKTRSPNLYERYSWSTQPMAAVMNNFVGDGNGYVGNPDLKPEVAHTLSASADWHDAARERWGLKVTPYFTYVQDYIDAQCLSGKTCKANQFNVLQYVNQSARLYGVDVSGHFTLASSRDYGNFTATGVLNYVKGENRTTGDHLYDIMPLNAKLAVTQRLGNWTNTVEAQFVAAKNDVSQVRNEIGTGGYCLFNLRGSYDWKRVRLDLGIENLFNRDYAPPLGGAYVGQGMTMSINGIPWGVAVPGMGRSIYAGLNVKF